VCSLPAAVALRKRYPDCEIVWAISPKFADVVAACRAVNSAIAVTPRLKPSTWPVIAGEFDAAFDLQGLFKSGVIVGKASARRKLGYHWQREGSRLFSAPVTPDPTSLHVVDQYVDVVRAYGAEADIAEFSLEPKPEATESVFEKLRAAGVNSPYLLVNAGAGWATKRWPPPSFAEMLKGLHGRGVMPVLIGGGDAPAREAASAVEHYCRTVGAGLPASLLGQTSVAELIALIAGARAHVGGDTGSTHIAAALGIPAIGLYSITRPERCCPYGQIQRVHYDPAGLDRIQPRDVLSTVLRALAA